MSAKINNFINLGIGNAGDGGESLPVYGVYWSDHGEITVFEGENLNNTHSKLIELGNAINNNQPRPSYKNLLFYGNVTSDGDDGHYYIDSRDQEIKLHNPRIPIVLISEYTTDHNRHGFKEYSMWEGDLVFKSLGIDKGIFLAIYDHEDLDLIFGFIDHTIDDDTEGIGAYGTNW